MTQTAKSTIAKVLELPESDLNDSMGYLSPLRWDSMRHVDIILAIEEALGVEIDAETMVELDSVRAIREFWDQHSGQGTP